MSTTNNPKADSKHDKHNRDKECSSNIFDGTVVSLTGNKLVMKNNDGKECTHTLIKNAQITCDGITCKPEDLKMGKRIRVTTHEDDQNIATSIESLNKRTEFADCT